MSCRLMPGQLMPPPVGTASCSRQQPCATTTRSAGLGADNTQPLSRLPHPSKSSYASADCIMMVRGGERGDSSQLQLQRPQQGKTEKQPGKKLADAGFQTIYNHHPRSATRKTA